MDVDVNVDGCLGLDMGQEVLFKCRILYEEIYYRAVAAASAAPD